MARILILANNDIGLYKFRKELIEVLVKSNEVYVSLPNGNFISKLTELGCKFIETPISRRGTNPVADLKLLLKYNTIIKKIKPDVVLTFTIKPNVFGGMACSINNIPYISNITGLGTAVENGGILQRITLFLYKISLKKAKCIFFQNIENQDFFKERNIIRGKYRLIPGSGVNLDYFSLLEYPPDNKIQFLFVSRVMKEKGIDQYLKAAEYIKNKYAYTVFHILGYCEQNYENKLKEAQDKKIIEYHGMQNDVIKFYRNSHCTIHPTYYPEGMSNVLLESASCGRPIITTNRSGCREIIDDGVNGYIVEQQNSEDLINKIEKFIELDYLEKKQMGLEGRKKVEKEFDRKLVITAYLDEIMR
ncbi:glycosyltransferase family 4 protein [Pseudoneobacillus rhizosphaerae]|uniref:N, N'-diacetylbacillosaminyl-diphospho-undecaprenol alpha-1,3-N-acetylgalactosaminyltransferase n=1 Tax=Pseudoneobacillus rhizosphaerae TaxID=2880968 RepID=A0A9C7G6F2_9BACI|nr:glycosyltransferase family 4 protein [Pseudoneobacillus rhizosphaerae]CAG9606596.1 N, N'-diacetylbacillosaminyl-diphospho-undecaprenol alpha-1,3-N-acetylgalactosaminyltransferase [Pseudoneobacillus rhizosphaerae]